MGASLPFTGGPKIVSSTFLQLCHSFHMSYVVIMPNGFFEISRGGRTHAVQVSKMFCTNPSSAIRHT